MNGNADNRIRGKIAPALLASLALSLAVFVFGPFELYANNMEEFLFGLWDFWGVLIAIAAGLSAVIFAALIFLPRKIFDVACSAVAAIALMIHVQGTFLTLGMTSVEGDGIGDGAISGGKIAFNAILWVIMIGAAVALAVIFSKRASQSLRIAIVFAMVIVLGMQTVSFSVVASTTEGVFDEKDKSIDRIEVLTHKGLEGAASENNVIYFVVDRFATKYFDTAMEECPEIFDELEGFTYYGDSVSLYPRTYPAITYLLTGVENDFTGTRTEYFRKAWSSSEFLDILNDEGYTINAYTDSYYAYEATSPEDLPDYIANRSGDTQIVVSDPAALRGDMMRLSLYRFLPFACHELIGSIASDDFQDHVELVNNDAASYSTDMKEVYDYLGEHPMSVSGEKNFSFIHIQGVHLPNKYDRDFDPATDDNEWDEVEGMIQSFKIINRYIEQLKELGLYEDTTIVITGDHTSIGSDTRDPYYAHLTSVMIKPSGVGEGELKTSSAPIMQEDLHATVLASEGIERGVSYGRSIFDIAEDETRERRYHFHTMMSDGTIEIVKYKIVGTATDFDNWTVVDRIKLDRGLYN